MKHSKKIAVLCLSLLLIGGLTSTLRKGPVRYPDFNPAVELDSITSLM